MSDPRFPGPLDEFLDHPPTQPASDELRHALLQQTTALLGRRRRFRALALAGAIAAGLLIAAAAFWLRWPGDATPHHEQPRAEKEAPPAPPAVKPSMPPAVALEWQAFDAPAEKKTALYRQAGDRYVEDADDLASAVRCYGQAVRAASAEDLEFDRNDSFLVMALKMDEVARRKEK